MTPTPDRLVRSVGITIRNVEKRYGAHPVLHDVSLTIAPGSFVALLGPSGCGKTTLLRTIAGLERPQRGSISIGDRTVLDINRNIIVPPQQRRLGMVFQHYALWPHMTVRENIAYPLRKQGFPRSEWDLRIAAVADAVSLSPILDRRPSQLSGGQQQRVALARALVSHPSVLLLDEPLSNLDANLRDQLRRELRQIHDRQGTTTILVTHDQEEAAMLADMIAVVNLGTIVQVGTPADILDRPVNRFVAGFVGYDNFLPGRVVTSQPSRAQIRLCNGEIILLQTSLQSPPGRDVAIAVRSDRVAFGKDDGAACLSGRVARVQNLGRLRETYVDCNGLTIIVREQSSRARALLPDDEITLSLPNDSPMLAQDAADAA